VKEASQLRHALEELWELWKGHQQPLMLNALENLAILYEGLHDTEGGLQHRRMLRMAQLYFNEHIGNVYWERPSVSRHSSQTVKRPDLVGRVAGLLLLVEAETDVNVLKTKARRERYIEKITRFLHAYDERFLGSGEQVLLALVLPVDCSLDVDHRLHYADLRKRAAAAGMQAEVLMAGTHSRCLYRLEEARGLVKVGTFSSEGPSLPFQEWSCQVNRDEGVNICQSIFGWREVEPIAVEEASIEDIRDGSGGGSGV
jgi:hypothetical protein